MPETIQQAVIIQAAGDGKEQCNSDGQLHVMEYDKRDRMKRAVMAWAVSWLLALLSVPIIFAHWVLVPGFFLAGPFMAYRYYHIMSVPKKITGNCPLCGRQTSITVEASDRLPLWTYCSECNESLHVLEKPARNC